MDYEGFCRAALSASLIGLLALFIISHKIPEQPIPFYQGADYESFRANATIVSVIPRRGYFLVFLEGCGSAQARFYEKSAEGLQFHRDCSA